MLRGCILHHQLLLLLLHLLPPRVTCLLPVGAGSKWALTLLPVL